MPRHIGIVGCSAEGAALCYKTICNEAPGFLGEHAHPEVSTHTHSLADYVTCLNRNDLEGVGKLMLSSAQKLGSIGAEVLICPDNTIRHSRTLPSGLPLRGCTSRRSSRMPHVIGASIVWDSWEQGGW